MPAAFLQSAQLEMRAERLGDVEIHFGRELAPRGFGWMVPVQRGATQCARIGLMCDADAPSHFGRLLERTGAAWGLSGRCGDEGGTHPDARDAARIAPRLKMLPLAPIDRTYADRVLAVGDAAGLVKPTTGGGIYYSLVSASLAAERPRARGCTATRSTHTRCRATSAPGRSASVPKSTRSPRCAISPTLSTMTTSTRCSTWRRPTASCRSFAGPPGSISTAI